MAKATKPAKRKTRASSRSRAKRPRAAAPAPKLAPTLGPVVCRFIEQNVVHGPGDYIGQPFLMTSWEKAIVYRAYELNPDGSRCWDEVLIGMPKGNAKSELEGAIAIAEAAGPVCFGGWREDGRPIGVPRVSPEIPVAAASFEQADIVFGACRDMIRKGPLAEYFEVFDTEILLKGRPGRLYRVAAVAGTNDGGRPTFVAEDEVHEWTGNKARVDLVLGQNLSKRAHTWRLRVSTAGADLDSLLGKLYERGKRIEAGKEPANKFLMIWHEAPKELDLKDPKQFEEACRIANPALGDFLPLARLVNDFTTTEENEFRRYHLNQWVKSASKWLPAEAWEKRADPARALPEGEAITLGLDGEWNSSSVALVGCTTALPRHLFVVQRWEDLKDPAVTYRAPTLGTIEAAIADACTRYQVGAIALNRQRWPELFTNLENAQAPVVEWNTYTMPRIAAACKQLYDAVVLNAEAMAAPADEGEALPVEPTPADSQLVSHSGDPDLARHFSDAVRNQDAAGKRVWITKAPAAVAAVIAYDMAVRGGAGGSVYETRGLLEL